MGTTLSSRGDVGGQDWRDDPSRYYIQGRGSTLHDRVGKENSDEYAKRMYAEAEKAGFTRNEGESPRDAGKRANEFMAQRRADEKERIRTTQRTENVYDLTGHPLNQIDKDDDTTWVQLTDDERQWMFIKLLGRAGSTEEIDWHVARGGGLNGFISGVYNDYVKFKKGTAHGQQVYDERFVDNLMPHLENWTEAQETSLFERWFDWTGIDEMTDPIGTFYDATFGVAADIWGIKEIEEYGPMVAEMVLSVIMPPAAVAVQASKVAARPGSDLGDVALEVGTQLVLDAITPNNIFLKAASRGVASSIAGGNTETNMFAAASSILGSTLDAVFPEDLVAGFSPAMVGTAALSYAVKGDLESAFVNMAAQNLEQRFNDRYNNRQERYQGRYEHMENFLPDTKREGPGPWRRRDAPPERGTWQRARYNKKVHNQDPYVAPTNMEGNFMKNVKDTLVGQLKEAGEIVSDAPRDIMKEVKGLTIPDRIKSLIGLGAEEAEVAPLHGDLSMSTLRAAEGKEEQSSVKGRPTVEVAGSAEEQSAQELYRHHEAVWRHTPEPVSADQYEQDGASPELAAYLEWSNGLKEGGYTAPAGLPPIRSGRNASAADTEEGERLWGAMTEEERNIDFSLWR